MNTQISISFNYDPKTDALLIKTENYGHETTIQLNNNNNIMEFDKKGEFIALEILSVSHVLETSIKSVENINSINLIVKVTDYQIFVSVVFTLSVENHKEIKTTNASVINNIDIPLSETIAYA